YYRKVIWLAFSHSIELAHGVIFCLVIVGAVAAAFIPAVRMNVDGPGLAAIALGTIVGLRLVMAPYWIYKEQEERIPKSRPEWQRSNTPFFLAYIYIATDSIWCLSIDEEGSATKARNVL